MDTRFRIHATQIHRRLRRQPPPPARRAPLFRRGRSALEQPQRNCAAPSSISRSASARPTSRASPRIATVVNGSLPAPTLRWREGDTVTIRVRNELAEHTSIHWHGLVLPANMDGVPGLELPRHRARRDVHVPLSGAAERHVLVSLALGIPRANGPLRRARHRAARARAVRLRPRARRAALGLDRSRSAGAVSAAEAPLRLLQLPETHARRLRARREARRLRGRARRAPRVGAHAHAAERPRRRQRRRLHVSHERPRARRQLDGAVPPRRARAPAVHQRLGDVDVRRADSRAADDRRRGRRPERASRHRRRVSHRDGRDVRRARDAGRRGRVHDLRAIARPHGLRARHARRAAKVSRRPCPSSTASSI